MEMQNKKLKQEGVDLLMTLENPTKENWDNFYRKKGSTHDHNPFEWYAEWVQLWPYLLTHLSREIKVLVPACGDSRLSELLYDEGFTHITNIDFSQVVIENMFKRNVESRRDMEWIVMDMTCMDKFAKKSFDVVLDKGGLDALMEPEHGHAAGKQYVKEVQRVLNKGGKFICVTLGQSNVLGMLFPLFRDNWKIDIHVLPKKPSKNSRFRTFMVVAENTSSTTLQTIRMSFARDTLGIGEQARGIFEALETENTIRTECLELGVIGRLTVQSDVISLPIDETERTQEFQNTIEELAEDTKGTSDINVELEKDHESLKKSCTEIQEREIALLEMKDEKIMDLEEWVLV